MVWYGASPIPWAAIGTTRCRLSSGYFQVWQSPVPRLSPFRPRLFGDGFISQAPAVAELRACAISLCLELRPPSSARRRAAWPPCR
jgi:hypothetical protein